MARVCNLESRNAGFRPLRRSASAVRRTDVGILMISSAMAKRYPIYPVGIPGKAWGEAEKKEWLQRQSKKRDYFAEVVSPLLRMNSGELLQYGELDYRAFGAAKFPLFAVRSKHWSEKNKLAIVTGGVHGYETSGIHGALLFVKEHLENVSSKLNMLVLPCLSPWGYETIHRWTPEAIDPNRQFLPSPGSPGCGEAAAAMKCIAEHTQRSAGVLMHVDLHETTDSDNFEFRPSRFARDGMETPEWDPIPDGFYLVHGGPSHCPGFQDAIIAEVEKVTHIAQPCEKGKIIGYDVTAKGVVTVDGRKLGLCGAHTDAEFATTTEVYPGERATPAQCNLAQATVVIAGIEYAMKHL